MTVLSAQVLPAVAEPACGRAGEAVNAAKDITNRSCSSSVQHTAIHLELLRDLDGIPIDAARLSRTLGQSVRSLSVVPGTERIWPQSHSAKLILSFEDDAQAHLPLYLKKIDASAMQAKSLQALKRDLVGNRIEARFYAEFAPELTRRGLLLPQVLVSEENMPHLDTGHEDEELLRKGGVLFLMESVEGYEQTAPLSFEQATSSVTALAALHAAALGDKTLLTKAAERLHPLGGYWTLTQRGEGEMATMKDNWESVRQSFLPLLPDLLERPEIIQIAARVEKASHWVSKQVAVTPDTPFATIIHGDYKAMNIFVPPVFGEMAKLIDFQWVGLGLGLSDVSMHLSHSVGVEALESESGEERLVALYRQKLLEFASAQGKFDELKDFSEDLCWRHYHLGVVDWSRMVFSVFLKGATPETFAQKSSHPSHPNVGLVYRNVKAFEAFLKRVDRALTSLGY